MTGKMELRMRETQPFDTVLVNTILHLENVFEQFDFDHDRKLDATELREACKELMLPCSEKDVDTLIETMYHGPLNKAKFVMFCVMKEIKLRQVFKQLDKDKSGCLTLAEFQPGLLELGWRLSNSEAKEIFDTLDVRHNGQLSYMEWRCLVNNAPHAMVWEDIFYTHRLTSADILGDNLRPTRHRDSSGLVDLLAGFVAGCASRTLTAPAERVKTEMQLASGRRGMLEVTRSILSQGGVVCLFQGNLANCLKVAPQSAVFFALTDYLKAILPTKGDLSRQQLHSFLCGSLAGIISQTAVYPLEPIKTCLTVAKKGQYKGILDCGQHLVRQGGVGALFRGITPTLVGCIPYAGVQRLAYDSMQQAYLRYSVSHTPSTSVSFMCGLVSSSVGMAVSYPLILVRTRLQVQGSSPKSVLYTGAWDCMRKTVKAEGFGGLMKGFVPNLLKGAPAAAVNFAMYEAAKDAISAWVK